MQDGQNLFDPATAHAGEWGLRASLDALAGQRVEAIVVGVWNLGAERIAEYSPFVDANNGGGRGDLYLAFLMETLKPMIDVRFQTRPERSHTVIAGSSMGGLISLYGFFRRPGVFGSTCALSPSVWFADRAIVPFLTSAAFVPGRIHLDVGAREGESHVANARAVRDALLAKGYRSGGACARLSSRACDREGEVATAGDLQYVEDAGGTHDEASWGRRVPSALTFLLRDLLPERGGL
jgi:predicted alpha/beta superfamily hydrolase